MKYYACFKAGVLQGSKQALMKLKSNAHCYTGFISHSRAVRMLLNVYCPEINDDQPMIWRLCLFSSSVLGSSCYFFVELTDESKNASAYISSHTTNDMHMLAVSI